MEEQRKKMLEKAEILKKDAEALEIITREVKEIVAELNNYFKNNG
jgi:hypothetical protein